MKVFGSHQDDQPLFENLSQICAQYGLPPVPSFLPDYWLREGDAIEVGDLEFEVRHLPGHAPGHIGFFDFHKKSIGRTDLYLGNYEQLIDTIQTKLFDLDDDFIIVPGHGMHTTIGREKQHNPFFK